MTPAFILAVLVGIVQASEIYNVTSNSTTSLLFSLDQSENAIADFKQNINKINVEIIGESLCPDTTRFLKFQLAPVWEELGSSDYLNITYHPFGIPGKTECLPTNDGDFTCRCQHGPLECLMNQLQACVISALPDFKDHFATVLCMQGRRDMKKAIDDCIIGDKTNVTIDPERVEMCAMSSQGRRLMAEHGIRQSIVAPQASWVPWIVVNDRRERAAEYHFKYLLCNKFVEYGISHSSCI
ncbi:unnamed protein product [Auanema sp. JU1783]|nr:unnamed protein product [Auanema sp. JU1783]